MDQNLIIKVKLVHPKAKLPFKKDKADSGWDLVAVDVIQKRPDIFFFDTGLQIEAPLNHYTQIVPRSSIYKTDFIQANSIGIIDSGYRGNLMLPMRFLGKEDAYVAAQKLIGQRIAQLLLVKHIDATVAATDVLSTSKRGEGGFGSSGL